MRRLLLAMLRPAAGAGVAAGLLLALIASIWQVAWIDRAGRAGDGALLSAGWTGAEHAAPPRVQARAVAAGALDATAPPPLTAADDAGLAADAAGPLPCARMAATRPPALARSAPAWPRAYASRAPPGPG